MISSVNDLYIWTKGAAPLNRSHAPCGQRQAAEPGDHLGKLVGVALQEQHVAGLDGEMPEPLAEALTLTRDR